MPTIAVKAQPEQLAVSDSDKAEMKAVRLKRRIFELISSVSTNLRSLVWRFASSADMQPHTPMQRCVELNPGAVCWLVQLCRSCM